MPIVVEELQHADDLPSGKRPETGPMQFGGDWPGVFIRGDNAHHYAASLARVLALASRNEADPLAYAGLKGIIELMQSSSLLHRPELRTQLRKD